MTKSVETDLETIQGLIQLGESIFCVVYFT